MAFRTMTCQTASCPDLGSRVERRAGPRCAAVRRAPATPACCRAGRSAPWPRCAPRRRRTELDGEAAARAAFRASPAARGRCARPLPAYRLPVRQVPAHGPAGAVAGAGRPDGHALDGDAPAGGAGRATACPAAAAPVPWHRALAVMAAACGAAAAVIVASAALAGGFSGAGRAAGTVGQRPSPRRRSASSQRGTSSVLGDGDRPPDAPALRGQPGSTLVPPVHGRTSRTQSRPASWSAENAVVQQLSKLAGGRADHGTAFGYCAGQLARGRTPVRPWLPGPGQEILLAGNQRTQDGLGEHGSAGTGRPARRSATRRRATQRRRAAGPGQGWLGQRGDDGRARLLEGRPLSVAQPVEDQSRAPSRRAGAPRRRWPRRRPG